MMDLLSRNVTFYLIFCVYLLCPSLLLSATLSGTLSEDETWSGNVQLTGDVTIPDGLTLTISPGAIVEFPAALDDRSSGADTSRSELIIQGSLVAVGTSSIPITFTSSSSSPVKNDWVGIRVLSRGSLNLSYSIIEYAANGIDYSLSSGMGEMTVINCLIHKLSGIGIKTTVANANTVFNGTFIGNEITETDGNGMYLYTYTNGRSELEVSGNTVHHVGGYGIHIYTYNSAQANGIVSDNEIFNTATGFYNRSYNSKVSLATESNHIHDCTTGIYFNYEGGSNIGSSGIPVFRYNLIQQNSSVGMRLRHSYNYYSYSRTISTILYGNTVSNNSTGIKIERVNNGVIVPTLTLNTVTGNSNRGISLENSSNAVILYNDIQGNTDTGLYLNSGGTSFVHHNNFNNEHTYELYNGNGAAVDARCNWWGDPATAQMDGGNNPKNISRIYDIFDNGIKGSVDYSEWFGSNKVLIAEPVSHIIEPVDGLQSKGGTITIKGIASAPAGIDYVEVSVDNGQNWQVVTGKTRWIFSWKNPVDGDYIIVSRVIDLDGHIEVSGASHTVTVDAALPTTSGTLSGDENWSGEIVLTGDVTVPENVKLTITT